MKHRTKVATADVIATVGLVMSFLFAAHQLHGWLFWLAFTGYCAAILAIGYLTEKAKSGPPVTITHISDEGQAR
jgi:hypothetical protein